MAMSNGMGIAQISTHAPLAGRDDNLRTVWKFNVISTHAPLAGRDVETETPTPQDEPISTHAPLAGRDWETCAYTARYIIFQPTRPLRGATWTSSLRYRTEQDFNPRAPCGARPIMGLLENRTKLFQPTRPLRGATSSPVPCLCPRYISTHAPLAGRDGNLCAGYV